METSSSTWVKLQQVMPQASTGLVPTSVADIVALTLFVTVFAGFLLRGIAWDRPDPYYYVYFERPQQNQLEAGQIQSTRNIAQKLQETDKRVVILWGSQSGTAEGFAKRLVKDLQARFGLGTLIADLSDYDAETIAAFPKSAISIFILSTYGEGDPSDNASRFWEWITKTQQISLSNLNYAAFGLGNSNYKYYNRVVDIVADSMNKFGANAILPVARADDAKRATEEDFISWKNDLCNTLQKELQLEEQPIRYQPSLHMLEDDSLDLVDLRHGEPVHPNDNPKSAIARSPIRALSVRNAKELFVARDRNCVHLELDLIDQPELHYKTGDHLAVWPTNPDTEVEILLTALGLLERQHIPICVKSLDDSVKIKVPTPTTISALFRYYLEICAPVSRDTFLRLAEFAPTLHARSYVLELGQGRDVYAEFISHNHITLGRLLSLASPDQSWATLPLSFVIETLSVIQPRYYSISSSSIISPRRPAITALVSNTQLSSKTLMNQSNTTTPQTVHGLTSNYLLAVSRLPNSSPIPKYDLSGPSDMLAGTKIYAHIRKSKFKLPVTSSCPIIMIAAGTGLAPFRAFIAERAKLSAVGKPVGRMVLFFGCRHPDEDFIYRDELEETKKVLGQETMQIITAFSRVQGLTKKYVQDRIEEHGGDVASLMEEGASLYICGRASMAREVGKRLSEVMGKLKNWNEIDVKDWSESLKRKGKWREDVWG